MSEEGQDHKVSWYSGDFIRTWNHRSSLAVTQRKDEMRLDEMHWIGLSVNAGEYCDCKIKDVSVLVVFNYKIKLFYVIAYK